jgi:hypothetical protein
MGVFIDAGQLADALTDRVQELVFNAYPRPSTPAYLPDAIVENGNRLAAADGELPFAVVRAPRRATRGAPLRAESASIEDS